MKTEERKPSGGLDKHLNAWFVPECPEGCEAGSYLSSRVATIVELPPRRRTCSQGS